MVLEMDELAKDDASVIEDSLFTSQKNTLWLKHILTNLLLRGYLAMM